MRSILTVSKKFNKIKDHLHRRHRVPNVESELVLRDAAELKDNIIVEDA